MNNNGKNALVCFFWLPILIFQVIWLMLKVVLLAFVHYEDYNKCGRMLARNPRRVSTSARQGMMLTRIGFGILMVVSCIIITVCLHSV